MVQTGLLPLSGLFAWVFLSFYSTGSTESFFKEKDVKSYQCPLKDLLLRHIFFLKLNQTRPNWTVFLSCGPEPSQFPSPTCTKHLCCQASGFQYLPVYPSHIPGSPDYILVTWQEDSVRVAKQHVCYLSMLGGGGEERSREKMVS